MGEVYKAEDTRLKRHVALKFLPAKLTDDPEAKSRFIQEAQSASALDHPNICTIHEIDETEDGQLFIAMAYYEGEGLDKRLENTCLSIDEALAIAVQIANGLARAHEEGIVHRDIKPANIMITARGEAKIVDFGVAKLIGGTKLTQKGSTLGTVAYMSPEQARGEEVDHRSDIWSLGVILHEMVTGKLPFEAEYQAAILYSIINDEPQQISNLREGVPESLQRIIIKALEKKPESRYQTVKEMLNDLGSVDDAPKPSQEEIGESDSARRKQVQAILLGGISTAIVILIVLGIVFWPQLQNLLFPQLVKSWNSIAVLSFKDMSPGKDQEYFCDGISEEIINKLANIEGLKVVARTSSFKFKGKDYDIDEIGKRLGVSTVLEGSVRKSGNALRVTAQLIDVADRSHIWSGSFDKELQDIFAVQDEIALSIVDKLRLKLLGEEKAELLKHHTADIEAHNLYLRGLYYWNKRTAEDLNKAIENFGEAIKKDPNYALAHAGLANSYVLLSIYADAPPKEAFPLAERAATEALRLDENLAEAHAALAYARLRYDLDLAGAERGFRLALELNPNYATGHFWYSELLYATARFDESIREASRALELDPVSLIINAGLAQAYNNAGRYDLAILQCEKILDMDPDFLVAYLMLANAYEHSGQYEEAIKAGEIAREFSDGSAMSVGRLGRAYGKAGRREEALKLLDEMLSRSRQRYVPAFWIATIYSGLGEYDKAYEYLNKAYEERYEFVVLINDNLDDEFRSDPRYIAFLKKVGLLE